MISDGTGKPLPPLLNFVIVPWLLSVTVNDENPVETGAEMENDAQKKPGDPV
jgi:hypothetical protein